MKKINLYNFLKEIYLEYDQRSTNKIISVMDNFLSFISIFFRVWNLYLEIYDIKEKDPKTDEDSFMDFLKEVFNLFVNKEKSTKLQSLFYSYSQLIKKIFISIRETVIKRKSIIAQELINFNNLNEEKKYKEMNFKNKEKDFENKKISESEYNKFLEEYNFYLVGLNEYYDKIYDRLYNSDIVRYNSVDLKKSNQDVFKRLNSLLKSALDIQYDYIISFANNIVSIIENNKKMKKEDIKKYMMFINDNNEYEIYSMIDIPANDLKVNIRKLKYIERFLKIALTSEKNKQPK